MNEGGAQAGPSARTPDAFKVSAIISVYDDAAYLDCCLRWMQRQQVTAIVIDNDATPQTREVLARFGAPLIERVVHLPREGRFEWKKILRCKTRLAAESDSDWLMLWDSDEIREAPARYATLRDALHDVQRAGCNAVNFSEFVFLPMDRATSWVGGDYVSGFRHYYFFEPRPHNRLTAWKRTAAADLRLGSGHRVGFTGIKVFPEDFVLRHYLFLSWRHAVEKYCGRVYSPDDLARGWSNERARMTPENLRLPEPEFVREYRGDGVWDRSDPKRLHPCFTYDDTSAKA